MGGKVSGDWRKADRLFGNDPAGLDESARGIVVLVAVGLLVGVLSGMFGIGGVHLLIDTVPMWGWFATMCAIKPAPRRSFVTDCGYCRMRGRAGIKCRRWSGCGIRPWRL